MRTLPALFGLALLLASPVAMADVSGPCGCGGGGSPYVPPDTTDTGDTGDESSDGASARLPFGASASLLAGVVLIAALGRRRPGAQVGD